MNTAVYHTKKTPKDAHPSATLRFLSHLISVLFHPLLIVSYVMAFLIYVHPSAFVGMDRRIRNFRMISTVLFTVIFPVLSLTLAWRLRLIGSIKLESRQDRLVGFILTMFFYFWANYVFRNLPDTPPVVAHFILGTFLAVCGAWMCTIFFKVSLHAVAMGGLVCFFILFSLVDPFASGLYLTLPILVAGMVCSARLILGAHNNFEMVTGFIVGVLAQAVAWLM
jgi:hypothetical protein